MARTLDLLVHHIRTLVYPARRTTDTDGQLLARWAACRDERAFAALVARHGALVWRVGRNVLYQTDDAEDVFQATFLVLARKGATLQKHSSVAGWLYQTAHRLALKARTATVRRLRHEDRAGRKTVSQPLEEITVREARMILGEELDRLPAVYREPLLLCHYEGATQDEAARQVGCSICTLKRRLERGRTLLGRRLSKRGLAPGIAVVLTLCSRSEIPARLVQVTIVAATKFASGETVTGTAAVLAEGVLRGLTLKKLAAYVTLFIALGGLTLAGGFAYVPAAPTQVAKGQRLAAPEALAWRQATLAAASGADDAPRLDPNGDLLPPGAIQRIGSNCFRHGEIVLRALYMPDGKSLASTSWDGYLNLWDPVTGKLRWRLAVDKEGIPKGALAVSADGNKLAVLSNLEYVVAASDTGKELVRHQWPKGNNDDRVRCLAIAADLGSVARGCLDATVRLYDAVTGQEKVRIVVGEKAQNQFPVAMELSHDARSLYVVVNDKPGLMVFDTKTGKAVQTLEVSKALPYPGSLVLSHKQHLLVAMDLDRALLWDLTAGKVRHVIEKDRYSLWCGAFSPDDGLFAVGGRTDIVLFDTATGKEHQRLLAPSGACSLAFAPDGMTLATADQSGSIALWNLATGMRLPPSPEPRGLRSIRFADNGKQLLGVGENLDWWEVKTAKHARRMTPDAKWYNWFPSRSVSPDGKLLAIPLFSGDLVVIDVATGEHLHTLTGHKATDMASMSFSPDGSKLFSAGWFDPRVIIWDVATGKPLHELQSHTRWVDRIAVSPNGRWLASAASANNARNDWDIRVWDMATGKLVHRLTPSRNTFALVFSADSSRLVSVGSGPLPTPSSGEARLWDVATGTQVRAFTGHQGQVSCVAMTADGRMLATGSEDKTLRLWEVAGGAERGRITGHEGSVFSLDFAPDGRLLAAASNDAPIYIWDAYATQKPVSADTKLTNEGREKLWQRLADTDGAVGFQAVCELIARPGEAFSILEGGWKQLPRATPKQMRNWVDELSSDQFSARKTATAELERFAAAHDDLLRASLKQAGSLEVRQRLEKILERLDPERLRLSRMLEVLEQIRTGPARRFLQALAEQTEDTATAREAVVGLKRLEQLK